MIEIHRCTCDVQIRLGVGVTFTAFSRNRSVPLLDLDGRAKSSFVDELNQRNERRSRMPTGGTGGGVVREQSLIRPRGKGVPPRDDDSVDAIVVMESTTQCGKATQHVSSERAINYHSDRVNRATRKHIRSVHSVLSNFRAMHFRSGLHTESRAELSL